MSDRYIQSLEAVPREARRCVLTIGNFDGVHVGHQRIVDAARSQAERRRCAVTAMTFEPPPEMVLHPSAVPMRILPPAERYRRLRQAGVDWVVALPTDRALLEMPAREFIDRIIVGTFAPCCIVEGENFFFGRGRQGTIDVLRTASTAGDFDVQAVAPLMTEIDGVRQQISSTLIRKLVSAGRVADAENCLGRPFTLYGRVMSGHGRGRMMDYPTANLDPGQQIVPADGIYAGRAEIRGASYPAAISVGSPPTFDSAPWSIEAFLLNAEGDFYDETMALSFVTRLRDQERFADVSALKARIAQDVQRVRDICR